MTELIIVGTVGLCWILVAVGVGMLVVVVVHLVGVEVLVMVGTEWLR